jgi:cyanophycinase
MDKHLFLNGGGPPFTPELAKVFVSKVTEGSAPVAVLFVEQEGWEEYVPVYTQFLSDAGFKEFSYLPLPSTPVEAAVQRIRTSSGIIIGGGDTDLYADYIVDTAIGGAIKQSYESGIPVAGFSAGALISPELCIISAKDNESRQFDHRKGLNLVSDLLLSVHFTQWEDELHLRTAIRRFGDLPNYGIDEDTCIYLLNGQLEAIEGGGVHSLENNSLRKL